MVPGGIKDLHEVKEGGIKVLPLEKGLLHCGLQWPQVVYHRPPITETALDVEWQVVPFQEPDKTPIDYHLYALANTVCQWNGSIIVWDDIFPRFENKDDDSLPQACRDLTLLPNKMKNTQYIVKTNLWQVL